VTVHVPVPVHAPDQPAKVEVPLGLAVKVTTVPVAKLAAQVAPQLMPARDEVTVPSPEPALLTVRSYGIHVKLAVTDLAASTVTVQDPAPAHAPGQPAKVEVPSGAAARVTAVPVTKSAEQVVPKSMPAGEEVTVPPPSRS
jgi:hypothetical protein